MAPITKEQSLLYGGIILAVLALTFYFVPSPRSTDEPPQLVKNPTFAEFESTDHDKVTYYELDMIDSAGNVVQTIQIPKSTTSLNGNTVRAPISLYPLVPGNYTSVVRAVIETPGQTSGTSPNGTRVPPASQIIDTQLNVWTLVNGSVLMNGMNTGGAGTELVWCNAVIYVAEGDGDFWQWADGWTGPFPDPCVGVTPVIPPNTFGRSGNSNISNLWERAPIAVY